MAEVGYVDHPDLLEVISRNCIGICCSQPCEDSFNHSKNGGLVKGKRRYMRPEKAMALPIARQVLNKVHRYEPFAVDEAVEDVSSRLPRDAFEAPNTGGSMNFTPIASCSSAPSWYSPKANNWSQSSADLALLATAHRQDSWLELSKAWLGALLKSSHRLLFRFASNPGEWYFALSHFPDSAVVCVPAALHTWPGCPISVAEPDTKHGVKLFAVTSCEAVEAVAYSWRSPAWQSAHAPASCALSPGIRACFDAPARPLRAVAAESAFWALDKPTLTRLASHWGVRVPAGANLFDLVHSLVASSLPDRDELDVMDICCSRLGALQKKAQFSDELAELDEAVEVLDRNDQKKIQGERRAAVVSKLEAEEYHNTFVERRQLAQKKQSADGKKKKQSSKRGPAPQMLRLPRWPDHNIDIEHVRTLKPLGTTIWFDRRFGSTQGHCEPFPRIGRSWNKYGAGETVNIVLRDLWTKFLMKSGKDLHECPVQGLFPTGATAAASSS